MKVARFHAVGDVRLEDVPEPDPGPGEAKIRVRNCSACGTDVKVLRHGHDRIVPPRVMGHEIAGEISDVGADVTGWRSGDRVQAIAHIPCGQCRDCGRGWLTVCGDTEVIGYHYDGGFAEYLVVPAKALGVGGLNRIPAGVSFAEASLTEPLSCVLHGQELAGVGPGDDVLIIGSGPVGCLHARLARSSGAARVFLADVRPGRLALAAARVLPDAAICPAKDDLVDEVRRLTSGRGADVVVVAAASPAAQQQALQAAAPRGRISYFAGLPRQSPVINADANLIHYRELTVVGAAGSSPAENASALKLIASGQVEVADLITHRLALDQIHEALDIVSSGEGIKVTVQP